jgi:hypothetical protein
VALWSKYNMRGYIGNVCPVHFRGFSERPASVPDLGSASHFQDSAPVAEGKYGLAYLLHLSAL